MLKLYLTLASNLFSGIVHSTRVSNKAATMPQSDVKASFDLQLSFLLISNESTSFPDRISRETYVTETIVYMAGGLTLSEICVCIPLQRSQTM